MRDVRVTFGHGSRIPGTEAGIQINSFRFEKLLGLVTGEEMAPILKEAMVPSFMDAHAEWPVLTGASRDSMRLQTEEVTPSTARVALRVGGPQLIADPRNEKHIDYAPFIEYNGTATAAPGIISRSIFTHMSQIKATVHAGVLALVQRVNSGR